ncbi:MAG: ATP-binding cassette domain-containing protein, partial [Kiritimatiellae bacterium]|nr:ATP-binding cassette domain-containing protein [Kiritimatiellia bacterium]
MISANLTVENINFKYDSNDDWALHVDKLNLTTSVVTCIVGPNGSGKSTLLRIAAGIL